MRLRSAFGTILAVLWFQTAGAQPCADYSVGMRVVGTVDAPHQTLQVIVSGERAYVRHGAGIQILDISAPAHPAVLGEVSVFTEAIASHGHFIYALETTTGPLTFQVIDASDPSSASVVARVPLPGLAPWSLELAAAGPIAYAISRQEPELHVVDASDPTSPAWVTSFDLGSPPATVSAAGHHALVPCEAGLEIVDLSVPTTPVLAGRFATDGAAFHVANQGKLAYLSAGPGVLYVVDWSDPSECVPLGSVSTWVGKVAVQGDVAYVARGHVGVTSVDVGDPLHPIVIGNSLPGVAVDIGLSIGYAYVANQTSRLSVVDTSDPRTPQALAHTVVDTDARGLATAGSHVFAAIHGGGLQVFDASSPARLESVAFLPLDHHTSEIAISGDIACVSAVFAVYIIDISAPTSPVVLATVEDLGGQATYIDFDGSYAYASSSSHVDIIDVTDPTKATRVGALPFGAYRIRRAGDHLYAASEGAFHVLDTSIISEPTVVGSVELPSAADFVVYGSYAYVLGREQLFVVDVSEAIAPSVIHVLDGEWTPQPGNFSIVRLGEALYVGRAPSGFSVVDVQSPGAPVLLGVSGPYVYVTALAGERGLLFVGDGRAESRVMVFPAQCGSPTPVDLSGLRAHARPGAVEVSWYASQYTESENFDVFRSSALAWGYERVNSDPVRGRRDCLFVDRSVAPLRTYYYRVSPAGPGGAGEFLGPVAVTTVPRVVTPTLDPASPNPFATETSLAFSLPEAASVNVGVYDVSGRRVRTLLEDELPEGSHGVAWDGYNQAGHPVADGAYVIRLQTESETLTRKVVLLGR